MTKARLCQAVARTKLGQAGPGWARLGRDRGGTFPDAKARRWKGTHSDSSVGKAGLGCDQDQAGPSWARL